VREEGEKREGRRRGEGGKREGRGRQYLLAQASVANGG
jgi:hypothetical protein